MRKFKQLIFGAFLLSTMSQGLFAACNGANTCNDINQCFTAVTSQDVRDPVGVPPDTMGDVGPEQYICLINNGVRSFNKETGQADGIIECDLDAFFQSKGSGPFDCTIRYNSFRKQWYALAVQFDSSEMLVAVGDTHETDGVITPCTKWRVFSIDVGLVPEGEGPNTRSGNAEVGDPAPIQSLNIDFPAVGIDVYNLYICFDYTNFGDFDEYQALILNLDSLDCAGEDGKIIANIYRGLLPNGVFGSVGDDSPGSRSPRGVDNPFDPNPEFGYIIGTVPNWYVASLLPQPLLSDLRLFKVINPNSKSPILSDEIDIEVPPYITPSALFSPPELVITGPHKGSLGTDISAGVGAFNIPSIWGGVVIKDPQTKKESIFAVINLPMDGAGNSDYNADRMGIRWFEIENVNAVPQTKQVGSIFDPGPLNDDTLFYSWPSLMVNKRKDILIGCSVSAENHFIDAAIFRRFSSDPKGANIGGFQNSLTRGPVFLTDSSTSYNFQMGSSRGQRWGDYTYTSLEHVDKMTMWTIQQFCADTDIWGLQVAEVKAPGAIPAFPNPCS